MLIIIPPIEINDLAIYKQLKKLHMYALPFPISELRYLEYYLNVLNKITKRELLFLTQFPNNKIDIHLLVGPSTKDSNEIDKDFVFNEETEEILDAKTTISRNGSKKLIGIFRVLFLLFFVNIFLIPKSSGQTKAETINYLNSLLKLHNNGTVYRSFSELNATSLIANATIYLPGSTDGSTLRYKFNPQDAQYISSLSKSNGMTTFVMTFKNNSVKLLDDQGETVEEMSIISMESLIDMNKLEIEKFIKGYKHLIKLGGGTIKDDPF